MRKKLLIAGGTGLVGTRLVEMLDGNKYDIRILTRKKKAPTSKVTYYEWDLENESIEDGAVEVDYIINLTGAGIADSRWTAKRKDVLIQSRVKAAYVIKESLKKSDCKINAYLSASAIGIYGDRADTILDENSKISGNAFMVKCCQLWEDAADALQPYAVRVIKNRIGIVLSKQGGALPKILMTKAIGIYNYFGNGSQYYSWIHIDDICRVFIQQLENDSMNGIYNVVSPTPITNKQFTIEIKDELGGIMALPAPVFGLRLALGEMANVVLNSNRVLPQKLLSEGFTFEFANLKTAVRDIVERNV